MRRLLLLIVCSVCLWGLVSCQKGDLHVENVDGSGQFPGFLVGWWKADRFGWAFKFERDGSIAYVTHIIWDLTIDVEEGGRFLEGLYEDTDVDTYAVFALGLCEAEYDSATRNLKVKAILDHYEIKTPVGSLEGRSDDFFEGPVSEDGKTWTVDWRSYSYMDGATLPDIDFINEHPERLVFTKVDSGD